MCFVHVDSFSVLVETGFLIGSCMLPLELLSFGSFRGIVPAETCLSSLCSASAGLTALLVSLCIPRMRSCHVWLPLGWEAVLAAQMMLGSDGPAMMELEG